MQWTHLIESLCYSLSILGLLIFTRCRARKICDTIHLNLQFQRKSKMLAGKVFLHLVYLDSLYSLQWMELYSHTYTVTYTAQYPPPTQLPSADTKTEPESDNLGTLISSFCQGEWILFTRTCAKVLTTVLMYTWCLYGAVRYDFDAGKSISRAIGRGGGPWKSWRF